MSDYTNNKTEKRVEKITTNAVKVKKKNVGSKFTNAVISDDARNVGSYAFSEVFVPAFKKLVADIIKDGIDIILYGEPRKADSRRTSTGYISYDKSYQRSGDRFSSGAHVRSGFDFEDIIFSSRGEAEAALSQMFHVIEKYGFVTVADLYDMVDLTAPFTSNIYGWYNLHNAEVSRIRDGYVIKLPRAGVIN